jgi:hypothetical protein
MPEHVSSRELLEPTEASEHALHFGDLQIGWPLNNRLPSAGVNLQSVLQLRYVRAQRDSRRVSGHIQRVSSPGREHQRSPAQKRGRSARSTAARRLQLKSVAIVTAGG